MDRDGLTREAQGSKNRISCLIEEKEAKNQ